MGSSWHLKIDQLEVLSSNYGVDPSWGSLFREQDLIKQSRSNDDDEDSRKIAGYRTTVGAMRQRLALMGSPQHTVAARVRSAYKAAKLGGFDVPPKFSFGTWIRGMRSVLHDQLCIWSVECPEDIRDRYVRSVVESRDYDDTIVGLPPLPPADLAAAICAAAHPGQSIAIDVSDLIEAGYYSRPDGIVSNCIESIAGEFTDRMNVIILTEGKTDTAILRSSLALLHPTLHPMVSFMDFDERGVAGGAGNLAQLLLSFAAAGIANRVVAVFDNDTAALDATRSLRRTSLPRNMQFVHLPAIKSLSDYPTIGPGGRRRMNVNGLAGSIELYLGHDVLSARVGKSLRRPLVQWGGYSRGTRTYQGEVVNKAAIQNRFFAKAGSSAPGDCGQTWDDLRAVWWAVLSRLGAHLPRPRSLM